MKALISCILLVIVLGFALPGELFLTPAHWPKPSYNFTANKMTQEKILLGRVLFYDPVLSANNSISCASCHSSFSAFTHIDHALSHGIYDSIGKRNSPALMNLAWQKTFMWDGAVNNLDMQALAPIAHPAEMGSSIKELVQELNSLPLYRNLFVKAFGDSTVTGERLLKSLSQFMLTLVTANSKYDKVMRREEQFTDKEHKGYELFKKNCSSCHKEPLFSTYAFANNGLEVDPYLKDYGKMAISKKPEDSLQFKIPTLRNIEYTYPYMHDGRFKKLSQVIEHYTTGLQTSKTLAPELQKPIVLTSHEKVDLITFLMTLSDKEFVFNTNFAYPKEILLPAK